MLTKKVKARITMDEVLEHTWITGLKRKKSKFGLEMFGNMPKTPITQTNDTPQSPFKSKHDN